jgi:hypothetical protein
MKVVLVRKLKNLANHAFAMYKSIAQGEYRRSLWRLSNFIPPPNSYKQDTVKQYGERFHLNTFIETGTFLGDMVNAVRRDFDNIASIELDDTFYHRAALRFANWNYIKIYHGDSAEVLPKILRSVTQPCLFWLDAHYSEGRTARGLKETPIVEELRAIFAHPVKRHVILVDDARCYRGIGDWPTLEALRTLVRTERPNGIFYVQHDIIRIHQEPQANLL